jgi:hypothetical protein
MGNLLVAGDIQQYAARDQWWNGLRAAPAPAPVPEVLVGGKAVVNPAIETEVVQCVDVGPHV